MPTPNRTVVAGIADVHGDEPVLQAALAWARTLSATLHLVHSFHGEPHAAAPEPFASFGEHRRHEHTREALEARARALAGGVPVVCHTGAASASRLMVEVAARTGAEVVVVGATRRGRLERWLLGTTAQHVLRHVQAPVLVVRGGDARPPRRVLLTGDLTELSAAVHAHTARLLEAVCGPDRPEMRSVFVVADEGAAMPSSTRGALLDWSGADLEAFLYEPPLRAMPIESRVRLGHPAHEIVAEAREWGADLVVMGTRVRTGAARVLWGSVAEEVLPGAPCDLLVVPLGAVERRTDALMATA
jgi:nucleotide-binding universal stress UspA family protein